MSLPELSAVSRLLACVRAASLSPATVLRSRLDDCRTSLNLPTTLVGSRGEGEKERGKDKLDFRSSAYVNICLTDIIESKLRKHFSAYHKMQIRLNKSRFSV